MNASPASTRQKRMSFNPGNNEKEKAKYDSAIQSIGSSSQSRKSFLDTTRLAMKKGLTSSSVGKLYQQIQVVLSVISTLEFIAQTYVQRHNPNHFHYAKNVEMGFVLLFAVDWAINFLLADHAMNYFLSFFSMVDVVTIIAVFSTINQDEDEVMISDSLSIVTYTLLALKTVRILRAVRFGDMLNGIKDAVERHIAEVSLDISVMILFFTALMQFLESRSQPHDYHVWIYYIWVTIATVGYGDITPATHAGRFAAMGMIAFSLISIPRMTNELIEKMKLQSVYARAQYAPRNKNSKHVVICGDLSSISLQEFFDELFHEDHDSGDLSAVMLLPTPPTVDIILLMRQSKYLVPLVYLEGSALVEADLQRAKAETAKAIFIMSNKFSFNADTEDAKSILLNLSIKRYLSYHMRHDMLYCTQLIRPDNRRHLSKNDANELDECDLVVCLNEIKMGAMAKAVMYPGANTLIMNLISSSSDDDLEVDGDSWMQEYQRGCGWEIYTTALSDIFVGAKFCDLSYALYDKIGVVLFALQITDYNNGGATKLFLNPSDYIIPDQGQFGIEAFVIAKNKASSDLSFSANKAKADSPQAHVHIADQVKSSLTDHRFPAADINRRMSGFLSRTTIAGLVGRDAPPAGRAAGGSFRDPRKSHWDTLKKQAMVGSRRDSSSYQEIIYHLEDEHFRCNFYTRAITADLSDVTVDTNVFDEVPNISNHIIIIGKGVRNLYEIIRPLRARYLPMRHIVLIYAGEIPHDVWQRIAIFDGVHVIRGSSLEEANLKRAGIFRATQVVVLADGSTGSMGSAVGMEALVDSDAIFSHQLVKRMNPHAHILVEIVSESNIRYLDEDPDSVAAEDFRLTTQFASGTLFTTSLLDSIVSQTYYNPHIIKVVNKLLSGVDNVERADMVVEALAAKTEQHAQNNGDTDSEDDGTHEPDAETEKLLKKPELRRVKSKLHHIVGSCLYQIAVPDDLGQKTYGHLFQMLSGKGIIPIGVLRGTFSHLNIGGKSNKTPYVFTNPDKDVELFSCDRIFVLSTVPMQLTSKATIADWLLDIERQRKARRGSSDPVSSFISEQDVASKHINDRILKINRDVGKKLSEISHLLEEALEKRHISDNLRGGADSEEEDQHSDDGVEILYEESPPSPRNAASIASLQVPSPTPKEPHAETFSPEHTDRKGILTSAGQTSARRRSSPMIGTGRKSISFSDDEVLAPSPRADRGVSPTTIQAARRPSIEPSLPTVPDADESDARTLHRLPSRIVEEPSVMSTDTGTVASHGPTQDVGAQESLSLGPSAAPSPRPEASPRQHDDLPVEAAAPPSPTPAVVAAVVAHVILAQRSSDSDTGGGPGLEPEPEADAHPEPHADSNHGPDEKAEPVLQPSTASVLNPVPAPQLVQQKLVASSMTSPSQSIAPVTFNPRHSLTDKPSSPQTSAREATAMDQPITPPVRQKPVASASSPVSPLYPGKKILPIDPVPGPSLASLQFGRPLQRANSGSAPKPVPGTVVVSSPSPKRPTPAERPRSSPGRPYSFTAVKQEAQQAAGTGPKLDAIRTLYKPK